MNSKLYGKKIEIPEEVIGYLSQCFDTAQGANENMEGYKRNQDLRQQGFITYQGLKRIKNWFDKFQGTKNELEYILNGADYMRQWIEKTLDELRVESGGSSELNYDYSPYEKDDYKPENLSNMNRQSKSHHRTNSEYDLQVTENLKRINELIKKII